MAIARRKAKKVTKRKVTKKKATKKRVTKKKATKKKVTRRRAGTQFFGTGISAFGARPKGRDPYEVSEVKRSIDWSELEMNFERELKRSGIGGRDLNSAMDGYVDGVRDGITSADWTYSGGLRIGRNRDMKAREIELADRYSRKLDSSDDVTDGRISSIHYKSYRMGYRYGFDLYCSEYLCEDA